MAAHGSREVDESGQASCDWLERAGIRADVGSVAGLVLFDENCGFCRRAILGLARADPGAELRFCALGSPHGRRILSDLGESETDRFMLVTEHGVLKDADAYVGILRRLHRKRLARLLEAVPRPLRRVGYGLVARNRWLLSRLISAPAGDLCAIIDWAAYGRCRDHGRGSAEGDGRPRR